MTTHRLPLGAIAPALAPTWRVTHATNISCNASDRTKPPRFLSRKPPDAVNAKPINRTLTHATEADLCADSRVQHIGEASGCSAADIGRTEVLIAADVEHWDILFSAVLGRLAHATDALSESRRLDTESVAQMQATVRECIEALEQLHATKRRDFVVRE